MCTISNPTRQLLLHHEQMGDLDDFLLYCAAVGAETIEGVTQGAQAKLKLDAIGWKFSREALLERVMDNIGRAVRDGLPAGGT